MRWRLLWPLLMMGLFVAGLCGVALVRGQQAAPASGGEAASDLPPVPKGVEVLARGPVHEAFAGPTGEAAPGAAEPDARPHRPVLD